jgi:hypothetical protein
VGTIRLPWPFRTDGKALNDEGIRFSTRGARGISSTGTAPIARDPEGHIWTFGQTVKKVTPDEWDRASGLTTKMYE